MKTHCFLNRYTCSLALASSLLLFALPRVVHAKTRVQVEDFRLSGSMDIIITAGEMTQLLWRNIDARDRLEIYFSNTTLPQDSFAFLVSGSCKIEDDNFFRLNWTVSRASGSGQWEFSFEGKGLAATRAALFSSLDSLLAPLNITTEPDSAGIVVNNIYLGYSPLQIAYFPIGQHHIKTTTFTGLTTEDSFLLTRDTTTFHFTLSEDEEFAYLKLLTPPVCHLYVGGIRLNPDKNNTFVFEPGEREIRLVSPQYGTRYVTFDFVAGDTLEVSFFNHRPGW